MSLILTGRPTTLLAEARGWTSEKLADWIRREIPCFVGTVPVEYGLALERIFAQYRISDQTIRGAIAALSKRGVKFDLPEHLVRRWMIFGSLSLRDVQPKHQTMSPLSDGDYVRNTNHTVDEYERRYILAIKTNNFNEAELIIAMFLQLIWATARAYGSARVNASKNSTTEWDDFNKAINEAMARAHQLGTHARHISRSEFDAMKAAPSPSSLQKLTLTFASKAVSRAVPASRRARR